MVSKAQNIRFARALVATMVVLARWPLPGILVEGSLPNVLAKICV